MEFHNLIINCLQVKLMNGEKAAFQTPTFALKRQRTLDTLIRDIYAEHCSDHKVVSFHLTFKLTNGIFNLGSPSFKFKSFKFVLNTN